MTTAFTLGLDQSATYWPPATPDGFGGVSYGAPVAINCRWQNRSVLFRSVDGEELTSEAIVYVDRVLASKGLLMLGTHTTASPIGYRSGEDRPREIRGRQDSPGIDPSLILYKVFL